MRPDEDTMRRTLCSNLTPEDRATHAKWVRVVATVYGCAALLLLLVAITLQRISITCGSTGSIRSCRCGGSCSAASLAQHPSTFIRGNARRAGPSKSLNWRGA
jgi:hypothetical protein